MAALPALTWIPVAAVSAVLALALLAPRALAVWAAPIAVVGALVGIPHGSADHVVPWWWSTARATGSRTASVPAFAVGYALVAIAALVVLLRAPDLAFAAFLVVAAVHFGRGEVAAWAERAGRPVPAAWTDALPAFAHGLVVVGLLAWRTSAATTGLASLAPHLAADLHATRSAGIALCVAAAAIAAARLAVQRRRQDCAELVLVSATFAIAPPLAAFGAYFGGWHALRHTGRLLDLARAQQPTREGAEWPAAARRLARATAWPSAVAFAAVGTLWLLRDVAGLQAEVSVLLALTFPHAAVVWALDRRAWSRVDALRTPATDVSLARAGPS